MIRRQRRTVAFVHDVEQVVGLFHGCHITVGHARRAQVHGLYDADEKHARNARPARSDPGQHDRTRFDGRTLFECPVAEGAMTVSMPVVWSSIGSSQPVGWLVTESVLMFRRVKPTVAMPLGASMKTAGLSNDTAPESLSLLHDTANAAASHDHGYQFYESFHIAQIYFMSV